MGLGRALESLRVRKNDDERHGFSILIPFSTLWRWWKKRRERKRMMRILNLEKDALDE